MGPGIRAGVFSAAWLGCWLVAFTLTHIPIKLSGRTTIPHADKAAHFIMYFAIAYLGGLRLQINSTRRSLTVWLVWALVYLAYGAIDEITQPLTGREADVIDWVFDALGVVLATFCLCGGLIPKWAGRVDKQPDSLNVTVD